MRALAPTSQLHQGVSAAAPQRGARTIRAPPPAPAARPCRRLARLQRPQLAPAAAGQATAYPAAAQEQDEELALLQSVVEGTELAGASLALVYDAQRDGWSPDAFHAAVDGRGPALVVALTASGALVGGFNPLGWSGAGGEGASEAAFLFYTDEATGELARLAKVGGPGGALQRDEPGQGIWFGDALVAPLAPGKERAVKSKLGAFYARKPSGSRHLYAEGAPVKGGARGTELASLQVWVAA